VTSWDALGILLWFGLPAWAGLSLYRLTRFAPEEEPQKWDGLTPTLFRGLLFCVLGHLAYASALPLLRQWPPLVGLLLPRPDELKPRVFDAPYLLTLVGVVGAAAGVGGASGLLNGWLLRAWRRLRRRAIVSPQSVWDEVFDGRQARWAVLYLDGGKIYEGQVERWSAPGEEDGHVLLTSPSEYIPIRTPDGTQWHVLDLQSDGILIPRSRVELIELRPTVAEWQARQPPQPELAAAADGR
jgi:uncharacterized protein DUF6338